MALLDFIELSDDEEIVDLSSDDETAEDSHNDFTCGSPGQHQTTMYDGQAVFVAEAEGEATESNAEEATPSSSVTEKGSLDTGSSQNCPHTSTEVSFPGPTSISEKALTFEACDANLPRMKVKRHRKLFRADTLWRSPRLEDKNKGHSKSMEELAVDLKRSRMLEEQNTSAASQNCSHTPASETSPNLLRVKVKRRRRKHIHTVTHWRSPRLEHKNKDRNKSVVELALDLKRSRMLVEQSTPARTQKKTKLTLCTRCRMYS